MAKVDIQSMDGSGATAVFCHHVSRPTGRRQRQKVEGDGVSRRRDNMRSIAWWYRTAAQGQECTF